MLETSLEDLARQELTPQEVREVLTRLGQAELGGSESATVAAVAEATNSDAETIGSILATLRGEVFRKRFEVVLDNHESRLARLEKGERTAAAQTKVKDYSYDAANFYLQPPSSTKAAPIVIAFAILIALAVFLFYLSAAPPTSIPGIKVNNQEVPRDHPIARSLNNQGN